MKKKKVESIRFCTFFVSLLFCEIDEGDKKRFFYYLCLKEIQIDDWCWSFGSAKCLKKTKIKVCISIKI